MKKPCKTCAIVKPLEDFTKCSAVKDGRAANCRVCARQKSREKYHTKLKLNPNYVLANRKRAADWLVDNREKSNTRAKDWYKKNTQVAKTRSKDWYRGNLDQAKIAREEWRKDNPEKFREYREKYEKANPEARRSLWRRRRARLKSVGGTASSKDILKLLNRQMYKCAICDKCIKEESHIDHIIPLARGGWNNIGNLQGLCKDCNLGKSSMLPIVFKHSRLLKHAG